MNEKDQVIAALRAALPSLRQRWPIRSLALFGSVLRGEANPESDIDLLIELDQPIGLSSFLALETELTAVTGRRVDLVSRAALKPFIGRRVLEEAMQL